MRGREDPAQAIAALSSPFGDEGVSDDRCVLSGDTVERLNMTSGYGIQGGGARVAKLAVDNDRARSTIFSATAKTHSLQSECVSEREDERQICVYLQLVRRSVYGEGDCHRHNQRHAAGRKNLKTPLPT